MSVLKAIVVHKAEPWNATQGSLLLLFEQWGAKAWLKPDQIKNYKDIKHHDNGHFQEFEVSEMIYEHIQYIIRNKKQELLRYKKGRK